MNINFYLPMLPQGLRGSSIAGGYKIVYEYSNYLTSKGHNVYIYYDESNIIYNKIIPSNIILLIKKIEAIGYPNKYVKLNKKISQVLVKDFKDKYIRDADISIATSYSTVVKVNKLSLKKGKKVYFIQDYEKWGNVTDEDLINTYKYNMEKVVVSNWLAQIVEKYSKNKVKIISNGINMNNFKITKPIESRQKYSIAMLYHKEERKGCKYGLEIIHKLKMKYPELQVEMFGNPLRPKDLPDWIKYKSNASEEEVAEIMNNSAIFMCTSLVEGFGLPGLEAIACGCALVTTNCLGIMEYANNDNAIISKPKDVETMYKNIDNLLSNNELRIELAKKANKSVQNRSLKISEEKFANFITA